MGILSLLARARRVVLAVVLLSGLVVGGGAMTGVVGAPGVESIDNRFGGVDDAATIIETDVHLRNPNPIGVQLGGTSVDYAVEMNGLTMAEGNRSGIAVPSGNSTLSLNTTMNNEEIPGWWVSHIRRGERTTVAVDADVRSSLLGRTLSAPPVEKEMSTDVSSALDSTETRPIDANQPFVSDPVLYLNETSGSFGQVSEARTPIEMRFVVYNPKSYPISASRLDYDIAMNGIEMGSGSTEKSVAIPPGETRTIEATTAIRNENLDDWWVSHVERDQVTDLTISFYARFDLLGESVRVPLDEVTHRIETDVFGTKNQSSDGSENATATPTPDESDPTDSATPTAESETPTDTAAGTPTPTATPTETDDGGILGGGL